MWLLDFLFTHPLVAFLLLATGAAVWLVAGVCLAVGMVRGIAGATRRLAGRDATPEHEELHLPDPAPADPPTVGLRILGPREGER